MIPIILFSAVVPLIMRAKYIELSEEMFMIYNGSKKFIDFYSYNKMILIIVSCLLGMVIYFKYAEDKGKFFKSTINKLLIIFAILIILSSILSKYQYVVYFGMIDRNEGMLVQLAYIFFVWYINVFVDDIKDVKILIKIIAVFSSVIGIIGMLEYFGANPLNTYLGKFLILPSNLYSMSDRVVFSIAGKSISSTLYNPNFVGSYMNLTFFMGLCMLFSSQSKRNRIIWFLYSLLMMFNLIGCNSAAGKVGFIFGVIAIIIFYRKKLLSFKGIYLMIFLVIFFILPSILQMNSGVLDELDKYSSETSERKILESIPDSNFDFDMDKNNIFVSYTDKLEKINKLKITLDNRKLLFSLNGSELLMKLKDDSKELLSGNKYLDEEFIISLSEANNALYFDYKRKFSVVIKITEDGYVLQDVYQRDIVKYKNFEEFTLLKGKELIGNRRGYIWKMAIPLLKENILIGSGPDTTGAAFPQNDLIGKFKYISNSNGYIDKPHNMYIQMGIHSGVISLIIYLLILIMYGIDTLKKHFNSNYINEANNIGVGLFVSVFSFSVAGLFNDSNVSVSPLFWALLGIGLATNLMVLKNQED
jgi:hypothetical protein